jgi:hypothetical protein
MPNKPIVFENEEKLVSLLRLNGKKLLDSFYQKEDKLSIDEAIKRYVGANTFRAFRKSEDGEKPSIVFREWTLKFIVKKTSEINTIGTQKDFDQFILKSSETLRQHWVKKMNYDPGLGRMAKLLNLVFKVLPKTPEFQSNIKLKTFLNVPLDSYSIQGLKLIVKDIKIPSNASMGFIEDKAVYLLLQEEIRRICKKADVIPITYDLLTWDYAHKNPT